MLLLIATHTVPLVCPVPLGHLAHRDASAEQRDKERIDYYLAVDAMVHPRPTTPEPVTVREKSRRSSEEKSEERPMKGRKSGEEKNKSDDNDRRRLDKPATDD